MKKEFPSLFLCVAAVICVFFAYALVRAGVDFTSLFNLDHAELSGAFRFLIDNKVAVVVACVVVVVAKLLAGAPGPVRS